MPQTIFLAVIEANHCIINGQFGPPPTQRSNPNDMSPRVKPRSLEFYRVTRDSREKDEESTAWASPSARKSSNNTAARLPSNPKWAADLNSVLRCQDCRHFHSLTGSNGVNPHGRYEMLSLQFCRLCSRRL